MSNQVGDCFKFLWPFQNVRTLTTGLKFFFFISAVLIPCGKEKENGYTQHKNCGHISGLE